MFSRSGKNNIQEDADIKVQAIPADFYGGANPVIKFKKVEKEVEVSPPAGNLTQAEKKLVNKETAAGGANAYHPANWLASRKKMAIILAGGFAVFILFASVYFWRQAQPAAKPPTPPPVAKETTVPPPAVTNPVVPTATEAPPQPTSTESAQISVAGLEYPSSLLGDTADLDKDGITDTAEELFGSDQGLPDTDGDGYTDGLEVYNLYNPAGKAPVKLIDSGKASDFLNPTYGYKIYYPKDWAIGNVDGTYKDVLFSALTGENIEAVVAPKDYPSQSFEEWFGKWAPGEKYGDLAPFDSKLGQSGFRRKDYLVYYFQDPVNVYVLKYNPADLSAINYRMVIEMMAQSFRLQGQQGNLPPQSFEESFQKATSSPGAATSAGGYPQL